VQVLTETACSHLENDNNAILQKRDGKDYLIVVSADLKSATIGSTIQSDS
jgi:hypothetical protein